MTRIRPHNGPQPEETDLATVRLREITPGLSRHREDGGLAIYLRVVLDPEGLGGDSATEFLLELAWAEGKTVAGIDPYGVASSLMGAADALVRMAALEVGVDVQQTEKYLRGQRRKARLARHQEGEAIVAASHCDYCARPVAFIEEGVKLCKRCAEELGVRPKGKV